MDINSIGFNCANQAKSFVWVTGHAYSLTKLNYPVSLRRKVLYNMSVNYYIIQVEYPTVPLYIVSRKFHTLHLYYPLLQVALVTGYLLLQNDL